MRVRGNTDPVFVDAIGDMATVALRNAQDGDVLLCMGAGSISAVPGQIVALLQPKHTQEASA
jgi:UDP-N-acetylmuramate--alanine ligase